MNKGAGTVLAGSEPMQEVSGRSPRRDHAVSAQTSTVRSTAIGPFVIAPRLDPLALTSLPAHVAMHSGVDAFVHAFESYVARNANPFTDALNLRAVELIAGNIRAFVADRTNLAAGAAMLNGSALAGMAFGITGLGNVHCLARFVGAFFNLPHGLSNALCLARVAAFNRPAAIDRYARLALILAPHAPSDPEQASHTTVDAIAALCRDLGVPATLREVGGHSDVFEERADLCLQAGYNKWNPRETTRDEYLKFLQGILTAVRARLERFYQSRQIREGAANPSYSHCALTVLGATSKARCS